jgi:hypothetical protein
MIKMKKVFYTAIAILGFANLSLAQVASQGSSHVYLGLGVPNPWYSTLSILSQAYPESPTGTSFGPISINYEYAIKDKITVGGTFGYSSVSIPVVESALNMDYKMNLSIMYVGAIGHYHYLNSDKSDLYSGIGLVYTSGSLNTEGNTGSNYKPVINIGGTGVLLNLIGYRYMFTDNIGAYATINYGLAPVNIGLSGKF